eukprot:scaffold27807_cov74-Isochrysis_galbana.AAC.2
MPPNQIPCPPLRLWRSVPRPHPPQAPGRSPSGHNLGRLRLHTGQFTLLGPHRRGRHLPPGASQLRRRIGAVGGSSPEARRMHSPHPSKPSPAPQPGVSPGPQPAAGLQP